MAGEPLPPRSHVLQAIWDDYFRILHDPAGSIQEVLRGIERVRSAVESQAPARHPEALHELHDFVTSCLVPLDALRREYDELEEEAETFARKAKEYPLQAVLRLHAATLAAQQAGRPPEDPLPDVLLAEVVRLLQAVAFSCVDSDAGGFDAALQALLGYFLPTLPKSLLEIYCQLEIQPPPALLPERALSHLLDDLVADLLLAAAEPESEPEADRPATPTARPPSPALSSTGGAALHPLLSRARSFSGLSACGSEIDLEGGSCSQSSQPRKASAADTARRVLQSIQAPNASPQPVDLSSSGPPSDRYPAGGLCLLRAGRKRPAPPAPPPRPPKRPPPPTVGASLWEPKAAPTVPEPPASPPRRWGLGHPKTPDRRRTALGEVVSPARLAVDETPPRAHCTPKRDLGTPAKLVIYESD